MSNGGGREGMVSRSPGSTSRTSQVSQNLHTSPRGLVREPGRGSPILWSHRMTCDLPGSRGEGPGNLSRSGF